MAINMTEDEIELKLRDFFEENFEFLKDSSGHSIDSYMKVSKGANRNNMYKYMCARAEDQDDFVNGNLVIDN